jgi:general secretion pathway protein D
MKINCLRRILVALLPTLFLAGCAASKAYKQGMELEKVQKYDEALPYFAKAVEENPHDFAYRASYQEAKTFAAIHHADSGRKLREVGNFEGALAEYQLAAKIDPSNRLVDQEIKATEKLIKEHKDKEELEKSKLVDMIEKSRFSTARDLLTFTNNNPITLKLTGDMKRAYESIGKVSGINVIFDSDLGNRLTQQVPVDLNNVTAIEALDLLSLQTKTYWAVVNKNTIIVTNDNQQTRQFYEEQVIKTFYLGNSLATADLQEILNTLRTLLDLRKVGVINSQNAIVIRDSADKIAMAEKILQSIDKSKPEVLIEVSLVEADRELIRDLGISVPTSISGVNPPGSSNSSISIKDLPKLGSGNFYLTIPSATFSDNLKNARILQNPTLRASDGKVAKLRIGSQQPVAQGSFQPVFGGTVGGTPVVQFTTINVGVDLDITPRVMLNRDIAMNIHVTIKTITGFEVLSGNNYPILANREVEHDIRLKEGESSVVGGIISDQDTTTIVGIPGVTRVPLIKYLFGTENKKRTESEIIIVITPHIVRLPDIQDVDLKSLAILGSGTNPRYIGKPVHLASKEPADRYTLEPVPPTSQAPGPSVVPQDDTSQPASPHSTVPDNQPVPRLAFLKMEPSNPEVPVGGKSFVTISVENAQNISSLDLNLSFDPRILKLLDVQEGGFMTQDGRPSTLVPRIENETGKFNATLNRLADAPGVSGTGRLLLLVFQGTGPGVSPISFGQANILDASKSALPASSSGTQITVK